MSHFFNKLAKTTTAVTCLVMSALVLITSNTAFAAEKNAKVAWEKIDAGALVVDVRTAEEFAQGHLANAINIPFAEISAAFMSKNIAKDASIVVYCKSGKRSSKAQKSLIEDGYTNTYNGGGYKKLNSYHEGGALGGSLLVLLVLSGLRRKFNA
ncbi:rhodanese-like domain-containing protein [Shewanella youngdeokensis]|uniref:Rhodanese-like domain-containing protein n=1 Tax=Shewanella youngdeokensis TaxID=2999068 RepID=A0ABZ0JUP9_9GAMM|nr:rhodanese-like domain-containing protein [Shewanella sp. DAU334]